jgi:hypothetical protein
MSVKTYAVKNTVMKKANEEQARKFAGVFVEHSNLLTAAPSEELQWAIQHPQDAVRLFVGSLINRGKQAIEAATSVAKKTLTVWKTINVGGTNTKSLLAAIKKAGNEIGDYARDLTTKDAFVIAEKPDKADLVIISIAELGFKSNPRTDTFMTPEFCAQWSAENLDGQVIELCKPEDGPQLRLQYTDQPNGEVLWMAMERIAGSDGGPRVFYVGRNGGGTPWLRADWASPDDAWSLDRRLVFRLRKIASSSAA